MKINNEDQKKVFKLEWLDPRTGQVFDAGIAVFNQMYGEYFLKIYEENSTCQYFLKPISWSDDEVKYRVEQVLKNNRGYFVKRSHIGDGFSGEHTSGNIFINYGSKYKTLVLHTKG